METLHCLGTMDLSPFALDFVGMFRRRRKLFRSQSQRPEGQEQPRQPEDQQMAHHHPHDGIARVQRQPAPVGYTLRYTTDASTTTVSQSCIGRVRLQTALVEYAPRHTTSATTATIRQSQTDSTQDSRTHIPARSLLALKHGCCHKSRPTPPHMTTIRCVT